MKNISNKPFNAGLAYAEYKQRQSAYIVAALTAFLMSAYFVVGYFAGHLRIMEWDGSQWAQALPSVGLVGVMTAYQFFLYSKGDTEGGKTATIIAVCVAVGFSLLSEIGQGMERDNIRMETKSQESPTYKAVIAAIGGSAGASYNPYSADLQAAEMKLAQCQARLAQGKEKHCDGSKARVDAVNKMIASGNQSDQAKALALASTAKTMERDEKNYHPLVNFIREIFNAGGTVASFLLSLTLISMFEYAFHYLGGQFAAAREYLLAHGYDVTRKLRQPPRQFDGTISTYSDRNHDTPTATSLHGASAPMALQGAMDIVWGKMCERKTPPNAARICEELAELVGRPNTGHLYGDQAKQLIADYRDAFGSGDQSAPIAAFTNTANSAKQTVGEYAQKFEAGLKASPEIIATEYARADYANKQVLADAGEMAAKIGGKLDAALYPPAPLKHGGGFKQSPEQKLWVEREHARQVQEYEAAKLAQMNGENTVKYLAPRMSVEDTVKQLQASVKASGATAPNAIREAVFDGFAALPNPAPIGDGTLDKIADKLIIKQTHAPAASAPVKQFVGGTGLHNPVLGTEEAVYPMPLPHAPHAHVVGENVHDRQPMLNAPHAHVVGENVHGGMDSIEAYELADSAKVGSLVGCPHCGAEFKKRNIQHKFCCAKHRDAWHNDKDPKRQEFMSNRKSKTA